MAFTSATSMVCGKSVSVLLLLLAVSLLSAPCSGQILTEVRGLTSFGIGVSEEAFHAGIADEDCDAPALNLLQRKAGYVKKAKSEEVIVSNTKSETDSKSQSASSVRRLPFFSEKTPKADSPAEATKGAALVSDTTSEADSKSQSESSARRLPFFSQKTAKAEVSPKGIPAEAKKEAAVDSSSQSNAGRLPFFSHKTPKVEAFAQDVSAEAKEGTALVSDGKSEADSKSQSESGDRRLPFFSQKTPKVEVPKVEVLPTNIPAEAFDEEKDVAVALFQTDVQYKAKPLHMSSLAVSADGTVGAVTTSEHATLPGGKMAMVFGADGSMY